MFKFQINSGFPGPPSRRQVLTGVVGLFASLKLGNGPSQDPSPGVSRTAEAIHQEQIFKASRKRVYDALTTADQFQKIVERSDAMQSMSLSPKPAEISRDPGGAFTLFGGYVTGRQIELIPNQRIVQAWRAGSWNPGIYSIARFELLEQGSDTKLVFDHTGFPIGDGQELAQGWIKNYWQPLAKFLA